MHPVDQTILHDPESGAVGNCFAACVASLLGLPMSAVPHFMAHGEGWSVAFVEWLGERGFEPLCFVSEQSGILGGTPCIASGDGPRGAKHSVVWRDGETVHDPHPSRLGLVGEPEWFIYLVEE